MTIKELKEIISFCKDLGFGKSELSEVSSRMQYQKPRAGLLSL